MSEYKERMETSIQKASYITKELEEKRSCLTGKDKTIIILESTVNQLKKQIEALKDQTESITSEMSCVLQERDTDRKKVVHLRSELVVLQQQMEDVVFNMDLKEELIHNKDFVIGQLQTSVAEYARIVQNLRKDIKDLAEELEDSMTMQCNNGFLHYDGTFTPPALCLATELAVQPLDGDQVPNERDLGEEDNTHSPPITSPEKHSSVGLKQLLKATGAMGLAFLLPVGFLSIVLYTTGGITFSCDTFYTIMNHMVLPYCSSDHNDLPPV